MYVLRSVPVHYRSGLQARHHRCLERAVDAVFSFPEVELLDTAKSQNSIVFLSSGKTFMVVMLVKELAYQVRRDVESGGKRVLILVPSAESGTRHQKMMEDYTDLKSAFFSAPDNRTDFPKQFAEHHVLVLTPEAFAHHFVEADADIAETLIDAVNLVVFDDCHVAAPRGRLRARARLPPRLCCGGPDARARACAAAGCAAPEAGPTRGRDSRTGGRPAEHGVHVERATVLSKYGSRPRETVVEYASYCGGGEGREVLSTILRLLDEAMAFLGEKEGHLGERERAALRQSQRYPGGAVLHPRHPGALEVSQAVDSLGPLPSWSRVALLVVHTVLQQAARLAGELANRWDLAPSAGSNQPAKLRHLLRILKEYKPAPEANPVPEASPKLEAGPSVGPRRDVGKVCGRTRRNGTQDQTATSGEGDTNKEDGPSVVTSSSVDALAKDLVSLSVAGDTSKPPGATIGNTEDVASLSVAGSASELAGATTEITAYILSLWLSEVAARFPEEYGFITPNFLVGRSTPPPVAPGGRGRAGGNVVAALALTPLGLQRQEEVLQKFRARECNLLVATSVVEEGIEVPRCNLVVRFDPPENLRAYMLSKGKAKAAHSRYFVLVPREESARFLEDLHDHRTTEQILLERSHVEDTTLDEEVDPAFADSLKPPYKPLEAEDAPKVSMSTAIALVNRYCAKLPSDTFTRLTPTSSMTEVYVEGDCDTTLYRCSLHLPINSPLKRCIVGDPMPGKLLAKQAVALKTCEELHKMGELDDNLVPQGKEAMRLALDQSAGRFPEEELQPGAPRPGTTKRRQYYDKKKSVGRHTSGRISIHLPEVHRPTICCTGAGNAAADQSALIAFSLHPHVQICSFPVFTRSGEVTVRLEHVSSSLGPLTSQQVGDLRNFHHYTFTNVLRLEKYPMTFDPQGNACSFLVVPINHASGSTACGIDWPFVRRICEEQSFAPRRIPEEERELFVFKEEDYLDTVVMPWYRNLDKPQFFYVAEICHDLNPKSDFPDAGFETFDAYYREKYDIRVVDGRQPLLDVDHTSARLNLLTPRYVNRKGVTLPTSSEQTKRAKRESLQQKQILVPELCLVHPFPASLWRKAVCLPCVLYRMNSLLLAEQLRLTVAREVHVGTPELPGDFEWPTLDFGWTLADVLRKAQEAAKAEEEQAADLLERTGIQPVRISPADVWRAGPKEPAYPQDLVIDTFDPSKVEIPDDDQLADQLADQEVSAITLGGPKGPNFDWKPIPKLPGEPTPVPRIRYGSPSNFEAEGWDSEWDTDMEDSSFVTLDMPGLGYISAPGVFNMQGLSLDLASCRDDDVWDSFDEDEEDEADIAFARAEWKESLEEGEEEGGKRAEEQVDWLSRCSRDQGGRERAAGLAEPAEEEREVDPRVEERVAEIRRKCATSLEVWRSGDATEGDSGEQKKLCDSFERISEALRRIAEYEEDGPSRAEEAAAATGRDAGGTVETPDGSVLAFGELLPDRDAARTVAEDEGCSAVVRFDERPDLSSHSGPSPSILLQALTMSNANDGINLERLETVGDSFLKYAVTAHLYCTHPSVHEGKLSHLRSRQISNLNLYRLGRARRLGGLMVATKFEPSDNWLPPGYVVPPGLERALIESGLPAGHWNIGALAGLTQMDEEEIRQTLAERRKKVRNLEEVLAEESGLDAAPYVPYNLLTQHSIPDKSIADCVEALIGAYLVSCGPRATLLFMSWLGLEVLPRDRTAEALRNASAPLYRTLESPLVSPDDGSALAQLLSGYDAFEARIGYRFRDRAYLLQAFTHASYHYNRLTDCYQRLEFLGDAVLDYLITRHLYDDPQRHSPGTLTDLRSALVNNTFFASLAVKYDFHRYFKNVSPGLFAVIQRFVETKCHSDGFRYHEKYYLEEEECEEAEEVEVPKALGDIFESVAGAIFLDSNMSLDTVWRVYYAMMKPEIEYFSTHVPKSPIRELLELEPQTAKFERAEMTLNGKVRIRVEVFGKGRFVGVGRNKRIAKCTAAKRALRALKRMRQDAQSLL
ncbi:hypothetical protein HPB47_008640 [Ixodes persulcatus]|uniref:Uncharacterized protein n=1 Tax=Ixodes persulcatus TaxID=34615 RepID=A0AC60P4I3_IXOPE|nr:hypothetical protein HPB47_008640 [Ixodes persulcatus]